MVKARTLLPYFEEKWSDNGGVYEYNGIEYTVFYHDNGWLQVYVRNPYIDAYDLEISLLDIGEANTDYLKLAEYDRSNAHANQNYTIINFLESTNQYN